jgi:hypothetical protein
MSTPSEPPIDRDAIRALRESTTPWQMSVRDAPANADPVGLYRLLIIVSPGANAIRYMAPMRGELRPTVVLGALEEAMLQTDGDHVAARPPALHVDDEALAAAVAPTLEACGVPVEVVEKLDAIGPVVEALGAQTDLLSAERAAGSPFLLANAHTIDVVSLADTCCLVIRVSPRQVDATRGLLSSLAGISLGTRHDDGRAIEVIFGHNHDGQIAVLSAFGTTHDQPTLAEELGGGDDLAIAVATGDEAIVGADVLHVARFEAPTDEGQRG